MHASRYQCRRETTFRNNQFNCRGSIRMNNKEHRRRWIRLKTIRESSDFFPVRFNFIFLHKKNLHFLYVQHIMEIEWSAKLCIFVDYHDRTMNQNWKVSLPPHDPTISSFLSSLWNLKIKLQDNSNNFVFLFCFETRVCMRWERRRKTRLTIEITTTMAS